MHRRTLMVDFKKTSYNAEKHACAVVCIFEVTSVRFRNGTVKYAELPNGNREQEVNVYLESVAVKDLGFNCSEYASFFCRCSNTSAQTHETNVRQPPSTSGTHASPGVKVQLIRNN